MNLPQQQPEMNHDSMDEFQSITRLIAINALMEAAKAGRSAEPYSTATKKLIDLAKDAAEGDPAMAALVDKQIDALKGVATES